MADTKRNETNSTGYEPGHAYTVEERIVDVTKLRPHPENTYKIDEEELLPLVNNIRELGVIEPPLCREVADGGLQIISGHRRVRALQKLAKEDEGKWRFAKVRVAIGMPDDVALLVLHSANMFRQISASERERQHEILMAKVAEMRPAHPEWKGMKGRKIVASLLGLSESEYQRRRRYAANMVPDVYQMWQDKLITNRVGDDLNMQSAKYQQGFVEFCRGHDIDSKNDVTAAYEKYSLSVAQLLKDFEDSVIRTDAALFRLRDEMRRRGQPAHIDMSRLKDVYGKFEKMMATEIA